jgi:hypothetical protein
MSIAIQNFTYLALVADYLLLLKQERNEIVGWHIVYTLYKKLHYSELHIRSFFTMNHVTTPN